MRFGTKRLTVGKANRDDSLNADELGEDGQVDLECVAEVSTFGSGEDFDCSATLLEAVVPGTTLDLLPILPKVTKEKAEEDACTNWYEGLPLHDYPRSGPSRWLESGRRVEVLGWVTRPGWSDHYLAVREEVRGSRFLDPPEVRVRLLERDEVEDDETFDHRPRIVHEDDWAGVQKELRMREAESLGDL